MARSQQDASGAPLLTARQIYKSYASGPNRQLEVLKGVDLDVYSGQVIAVIGESGTGKSTLLHVLGALDRPDSGEVKFTGKNIFAQNDEALARFRNSSIGFIFQFHHLLPEFTALENVAMPALIQGKSIKSAGKRAQELLELLRLGDRAEHRPGQLSGGEQQRVAVARALMNEPALVLADEPTGNLDTRTAEALHDEIIRLSRAIDQAFLLVTHNLSLAARTDRVLRLEDGVLVEEDVALLASHLTSSS